MQPDEPGTGLPPAFAAASTAWQVTVFIGVVTLILGLIVSFRPSASLNVIAVLIGLLMIVSGIFSLIRVFDSGEAHRVWLGISGLLLMVIGVVLIRHLHLTVALIGLIVGLSWIVEGVSALVSAAMGGRREGRGWWIFFGLVSLIAGIVVVAVPVSSVTALAVLVGIWFIIVGLFEIAGGLMLRRGVRKARAAVTADQAAAAL